MTEHNVTKELTEEVNAHRQPALAIDPLILNRWSPRSFASTPVPEEKLMSILEAARWAPSGSNNQPWRYILARTEEDRAVFHSFIVEANLDWCKRAPVLLVLAADSLTPTGKPNPSYTFDAGTSWGYLALEATRQGLITHAMGGFNKEAAREALKLPDHVDPCVVIAIGYRGPLDQLNEQQQEREKPSGRKDMSEILFEGVFKI